MQHVTNAMSPCYTCGNIRTCWLLQFHRYDIRSPRLTRHICNLQHTRALYVSNRAYNHLDHRLHHATYFCTFELLFLFFSPNVLSSASCTSEVTQYVRGGAARDGGGEGIGGGQASLQLYVDFESVELKSGQNDKSEEQGKDGSSWHRTCARTPHACNDTTRV